MRLTLVWVGVLGAMALAPGWHPPVAAQARDFSRVRVLAVAPFGDENPLSRRIAESGAQRLSELLRGGRVQIIDAARAADQLKVLGVRPIDLISPTRTVELGTALGADAVLTGRVVQISEEVRRERHPVGISVEGRAVVDLRILEVSSRLILWQEEMACSVPSSASSAMECLVRQVAARVTAVAADAPGGLAAGRD